MSVLVRFISLENIVHRLLVRHSISTLPLIGRDLSRLRGFKYYPGISPAEMLSTENEVQ